MSLPSLPPDHLPHLVIVQQPSPAALPAKGPPRSFWGGWGLLGWMLALSVGLSLFGSLSFAVAVSWGFWSMSSAVSEAIDGHAELRASRLKAARQFAKNRLADYGITELAKESHLRLDGAEVHLSGMAQHRTGSIYPYSIRWRVATFDRQTRWDVVDLVLDGVKREH